MARSIYGSKVQLAGNSLLVGGAALSGRDMPVGLGRGKTWYVDSTGAGGNGKDVKNASLTLQAVIDKLDLSSSNDNVGHTIVVLPNHSETITGAGGLTFDVPGVRVIGLGVGNNRPEFLMDGGTTVTAVVSAADVWIENCVFVAGHSDIASCFDLDAAGFHLVNCEFRDNTTKENFLIGILSGSTTDNVCDGLTLVGNRFYTGTDSHTCFLKLVGDIDRMRVIDNLYMQGQPGGSAGSAGVFIEGTAGDDVGFCYIKNNDINVYNTASDAYVLLGSLGDQTDNTGIVVNNNIGSRCTIGTTGAAGQQIYSKGTGYNFINNRQIQELTNPARVWPFPTDEAGWFQ